MLGQCPIWQLRFYSNYVIQMDSTSIKQLQVSKLPNKNITLNNNSMLVVYCFSTKIAKFQIAEVELSIMNMYDDYAIIISKGIIVR